MKKIFSMFLALAMILTLAVGCGAGNSDTSDAADDSTDSGVITIKMGHVLNEDSPFHAASVKFAELVEEKSGGTMKVEVYPSALLGNDRELAEGLQLGTVDAAIVATATVAGFCPEIQVFDLPFLFKNNEHVYEVLDGEIGQQLKDIFYEKSGIVALSFPENGWRQVTNSKHPVTKASDMEGLKIRVMEIPCHLDYWKSLGCDPTPMAWTEVYTALQQGTVDGQENPVQTIYTQKIYEVQKCMSMTNHVYCPAVIMLSANVWNNLNEEQQKICEDAAAEAATYERQVVYDLEATAIEELPSFGVELVMEDEIDMESFRAAATEINEKYAKELGMEDVVEQIQAIGEKY